MLGFAAMMGWCGTKWPGWWRGPRPPQPDPWWWIVGLAGAGGGVLAWMAFKDVIGDAGFFAGALTAFAGGIAVGSIVDGLSGMIGGGNRAGPSN